MKKFFGFNISDELAGYFESDLSTNRDMEDATILFESGIMPYLDGNQWCVLVGENLQSGICGFGNTIHEAFVNFMKDVKEMQERRISKQPSLPEGLEEAAEESSKNIYPYEDDCHIYDKNLVDEARAYHKCGFKEGAKWDRAKLLEWAKEMYEAYRKRYEQRNALYYRERAAAFLKVIDKLNEI